MDKQIIQDQISGLIEQGKTLRQQEAIFLKMTGINEEIIKTNIDRENNKDNLVKAKEIPEKTGITEKRCCPGIF